jgi:hypothetical protein
MQLKAYIPLGLTRALWNIAWQLGVVILLARARGITMTGYEAISRVNPFLQKNSSSSEGCFASNTTRQGNTFSNSSSVKTEL